MNISPKTNTANPLISIIIPTLNEERVIRKTLVRVLALKGKKEVIVVDGGSTDRTTDIVRAFSQVRLVLADLRGRSFQMNRGAQMAEGEYLFFIHADTLPPSNAISQLLITLADPRHIAAGFRLRFDTIEWKYRLLEWVAQINLPFVTYGDQGLFLKRSTFWEMKGFKEIPIMEDLDFQHRLRRRGKFVKMRAPVITSARRFKKNGFVRQFFQDAFIMIAYYLGCSPFWLKRWYSDAAERSR